MCIISHKAGQVTYDFDQLDNVGVRELLHHEDLPEHVVIDALLRFALVRASARQPRSSSHPRLHTYSDV